MKHFRSIVFILIIMTIFISACGPTATALPEKPVEQTKPTEAKPAPTAKPTARPTAKPQVAPTQAPSPTKKSVDLEVIKMEGDVYLHYDPSVWEPVDRFLGLKNSTSCIVRTYFGHGIDFERFSNESTDVRIGSTKFMRVVWTENASKKPVILAYYFDTGNKSVEMQIEGSSSGGLQYLEDACFPAVEKLLEDSEAKSFNP